ncbi:uncharacterized protein LOC127858558 [Dreissena polymorpha]|uniref:uncharacterized protein LOC127858558 n=1 Tax=Dreissena polymorpha TaxID=45954 RepID=UPI0022645B2B|nr:uncharacterized protein LOC127858558 [Dreissena polymorpha]
MAAFPAEDRAQSVSSLDIFADDLPIQASLGLSWNISEDLFSFNLNIPDTPFTKRGVISAVSSIFDPLGFLSPITFQGKILAREITAHGSGMWDERLPDHLEKKWKLWKELLKSTKGIRIRRKFLLNDLSYADSFKVDVFSDASEKAISAVAYMRALFGSKEEVGFIMGKSKLTPAGGTTIPRLELCAALLATELANVIADQLSISLENFLYHTDSRVVLGYIHNRKRRFYTYVANRVDIVLKQPNPQKWQYVVTQNNPADLGTRPLTSPNELTRSI